MHSIRAVPRESGNKDPSSRTALRVFFICPGDITKGPLPTRRRLLAAGRCRMGVHSADTMNASSYDTRPLGMVDRNASAWKYSGGTPGSTSPGWGQRPKRP